MPKEKTEAINEIEKDIRKYGQFESLASTEGGKALIVSLEKDFVASIDELTSSYKKMKLEELIPIIARLDIVLSQLRIFYRASDQKQGALTALKEEEKRGLEAE